MSERNHWPLLSNELASCIDTWDHFENPEDEESREARNFFEKAIRIATRSVESLSEQWIEKLQVLLREDQDHFRSAIDDFYSRKAVQGIRATVNRFLGLEPALVAEVPQKDIVLYLEQATRCYLYGLSQACVALSRAAVEIALDGKFVRHRVFPNGTMEMKIKQAQKLRLITEEAAILVDKVRVAGKTVLHKKPVSDEVARDTLDSARGALVRFYS